MDIVKKDTYLPVTVEELNQFIIIGKERLNAQKAKIRAIEKTGMAVAAKEAALTDAQDMADLLLDAEARLGEILEAIPDKKASSGAGTRSLPSDITKKVSHQAQVLSQHRDVIERVKAEAREAGEIPTAKQVYHQIKDKQKKDRAAELGTASIPEGKYRIFYADPPWQYTSGDQHTTEEQETVLGTHYPSMSIPELCALDIRSMAQDNAVLFMWVTSPLLEEAFEIINAWGFKYKASMVWDKVKHNVGHYVSVRHEFLFICTKGSCKPDNPKLYDSVLSIERTTHSKKPEEFRAIIDDLYPRGRRIELFARQEVNGWDSWGNEI